MSYKIYNRYGVKIHVYEFNPFIERLAVEIGIKDKLERPHLIPRPKPDEEVASIINFNFFDWTGNSNNGYGEIEQNGIQLKPESKGFPSISFKDGKLVLGDLKNAQMGVGIGATLILDGKINIQNPSKVSTGRDANTAIGQKNNDNIIFVVAEGDDAKNKGVTSKELASFMLELGCRVAFQGDRGGSSSMWCNGKYIYDQGRAVAACLVAYRKKTQKNNIYKVIASSLNVRHSPSLFGKVVDKYLKNTLVEILETKNGWLKTNKGWISAKYAIKV